MHVSMDLPHRWRMHQEQAGGQGRRAAFVAALQEGRSVTGAAMAAGVNRTLVYRWREEMADFAAAWDEAVEAATDLIEEEAWRRALRGVPKPVFWRGAQIGVVTTYSERLLMFLLQRRRPVAAAARARAEARARSRVARDMVPDIDERYAAAMKRLEQSRREEAEAGRAGPEPAAAGPDGPLPPAAAPDDAGEASPFFAPIPDDTPAVRPAAPPPDDDDEGPPSPTRQPPRRKTRHEEIYGVPLSQMTRTAHLTSAQALEMLSQGPPDPGFATFPPPWGPGNRGRSSVP
jgi:hypothetical protein